MTDSAPAARVATAPTPVSTGDGSSIPARLRIVAWITLAAGLGLLSVVLTVRSALTTDVEEAVNSAVEQEVDEFRTFAREGRDPQTGERFGSADRLLELYLQRQFPSRGEVLVGWDLDPGVQAPEILQDVPDEYGLTDDRETLRKLVESEQSSGIDELNGEPFRWGRAAVLGPDGEPAGVFLVAEFLEPEVDEVQRTTRLIVLVSIGGLVLTALIAFAVAGQILAPVRTVRRAAARITRTDLQQRIEVRGRDDLAALATTFNAMLDRLERSFRAQQHVVGVADRGIRGPLAIAGDPDADDETRAAAARDITSTLDAIALLTSSQLPGFLDAEEHSGPHVAEVLAEQAQGATPGWPWDLRGRLDGDVHIDLSLARAAIDALARNAALQHQGPDPLRFGVAGDDEAIEVWVEDDGPGLDEERARHLLDRYLDLGQDPLASDETGLGLAVVRAVADAHEGSAWVETAPGDGARFGLRLPRRPVGDRDQPTAIQNEVA